LERVTTLEEAMNWFLKNSSGNVICKKDNIEEVVTCYPQAKEFFNS
jgi:hypothetical protein